VRSQLLTLTRDVADTVARHLVAAGQVIDEDPDLALAHAVAARRLASRIAVVREAVGLAAYAAGDWQTAIAELRTYHRMTGHQTHLAEIADCERALGRPERAIDIYRGADPRALDQAEAIELLIVAAGARGDLGQHDAAVSMLQVPELTADRDAIWAARLRYAYADALLAAGRREDAREWFTRAAAVDQDDTTDAAERLLELDGITIDEDEDQPADRAADDEPGAADRMGARADGESDEDGAIDEDGTVDEDDAIDEDGTVDEDDAMDEDDAVGVRADVGASVDLDDNGRAQEPEAFTEARISEVSEDRLAEDIDGGIDVPTTIEAGAGSSVNGDAAANGEGVTDVDDAGADDKKSAEDMFVAGGMIGDEPVDEDGVAEKRPPA
jgi:tetratricopeptide (TPR) repeat protein